MGGFDEPITDDAYLEPLMDDLPAVPRIGTAAPAPPREAWQRFLQSVQERSASQAAASASRYSQGELLYVIDRQSPRGELVPTVQVHSRTWRKNGEWGKPQPAALAVADVPHLPDPDDREIVALLLGAIDPQAAGMQYVSVATRASFRITGPLIERVLPLIARLRGRPPPHRRARDRPVRGRCALRCP